EHGAALPWTMPKLCAETVGDYSASRTIRLYHIADEGRQFLAGAIEAGKPAEPAKHTWPTLVRGTYVAHCRGSIPWLETALESDVASGALTQPSAPLTRRRCPASASPLRPVLGLLHGDLIDVRQGPGAGGTLDGLDGDVLHLLFGLCELLLERRDVSGIAGESLLQRLRAQFR